MRCDEVTQVEKMLLFCVVICRHCGKHHLCPGPFHKRSTYQIACSRCGIGVRFFLRSNMRWIYGRV